MKISNFEKKENIISYSKREKKEFFDKKLINLIQFHYKNCSSYKKILNKLNYNLRNKNLYDIPFLPVSLFKKFDLYSVKFKEIKKILRSSGTTGSIPSKIHLDSFNSKNQTWVLSKIIEKILGKKRLPMLVIDKSPKGLSRFSYNARVAAINGFSIFGKEVTYLLDNKGQIDKENLDLFLKKYSKEKFFIFGFTNYIYENLIQKKLGSKKQPSLKNAILIHGGGWKKLEEKSIDNKIFKKKIRSIYNIEKIYNYYGLIEQTGSIFIECPKCSCFKCSIYSDVIIRDKNLNIITKDGKKGFLQVMSLLPTSYPGNSLLTEDIAELKNDIKCVCDNGSKKFVIHGRSKNSELRGCANI